MAARDYLKCLETFTDDIVVRDVYMGGGKISTDPWIEKYVNRHIKDKDVLIQKVLPHYFYRDCRFRKNVAISVFECEHSYKSDMHSRFKLLDHLIVPSKEEEAEWNRIVPTTSVGEPVSMTYNPNAATIRDRLCPNDNSYIFYTIGENNERKNLRDLIRAYTCAFSRYDNVSLVIKTNEPIKDMVQGIQAEMRIREKAIQPLVYSISDYLSDDEMYSLHQSCDCFVSMTHGEAWCRPALEAALCGNKTLVTSGTGMDTFLDFAYNDRETGRIESNKVPCDVMRPPLKHYYTANDSWRAPDMNHMIFAMQEAYNAGRQEKQWNNALADEYSYTRIGERIKKCLEL